MMLFFEFVFTQKKRIKRTLLNIYDETIFAKIINGYSKIMLPLIKMKIVY